MINSLIKNKKGDVFQVFFMLVIIFIVAIIALISLVWSHHVNNALLNITSENTTAYIAVEKISTQTPTILDDLVFFLFLGMTIGIFIGAVRTNFSAIMIFLFILEILLAILVASGLVNIYHGFTQAPGIVELSSNLTLTNLVFSRYTPLFICIISAVSLILMYSKSGGDIQ